MARLKSRSTFVDPTAGPVFTKRFLLSLVLMVVGGLWVLWFFLAFRAGASADFTQVQGLRQPRFVEDWGRWNYVIGFGLFFLGLIVAAHRDTPLGRGRGVVVGMLGCFLLGLAWICVFYIFSNNLDAVPLFNDLGQTNLIVGIAFMAVGFAFATKWE